MNRVQTNLFFAVFVLFSSTTYAWYDICYTTSWETCSHYVAPPPGTSPACVGGGCTTRTCTNAGEPCPCENAYDMPWAQVPQATVVTVGKISYQSGPNEILCVVVENCGDCTPDGFGVNACTNELRNEWTYTGTVASGAPCGSE